MNTARTESGKLFRQCRAAAGIILLIGQKTNSLKVVVTCQLRRGQPSWELPQGRVETGLTNKLVMMAPLYGYSQRVHWFLAHCSCDSELMWGPILDKDTLEARCVTLEE